MDGELVEPRLLFLSQSSTISNYVFLNTYPYTHKYSYLLSKEFLCLAVGVNREIHKWLTMQRTADSGYLTPTDTFTVPFIHQGHWGDCRGGRQKDYRNQMTRPSPVRLGPLPMTGNYPWKYNKWLSKQDLNNDNTRSHPNMDGEILQDPTQDEELWAVHGYWERENWSCPL